MTSLFGSCEPGVVTLEGSIGTEDRLEKDTEGVVGRDTFSLNEELVVDNRRSQDEDLRVLRGDSCQWSARGRAFSDNGAETVRRSCSAGVHPAVEAW